MWGVVSYVLNLFNTIFIHNFVNVLEDLNFLNKMFQIKNLNQTDIGTTLEFTTQSISKKFLVDEDDEFGGDTKFMAQFLKIFRCGIFNIEIQQKWFILIFGPCTIASCKILV